MAKIFISYRRDDSEYQTDRLHRELKQYVQNPREDIFIDVDNIPFGVDFVEHLQGKVSQCEMLLAVIGKGWLDHTNDKTGARSLDDPSDFVRIEISTALARDIPVVPVLLDGTAVPAPDKLPDDLKSLSRRNGKFVNRMSFSADVKSLVEGLSIQSPPQSPVSHKTDGGDPSIEMKRAWNRIESSVNRDDYDDFKNHFATGEYTFEATRRNRLLDRCHEAHRTPDVLNAEHVILEYEYFSAVDLIDASGVVESAARNLEEVRAMAVRDGSIYEALDKFTQEQVIRLNALSELAMARAAERSNAEAEVYKAEVSAILAQDEQLNRFLIVRALSAIPDWLFWVFLLFLGGLTFFSLWQAFQTMLS